MKFLMFKFYDRFHALEIITEKLLLLLSNRYLLELSSVSAILAKGRYIVSVTDSHVLIY